MNIQQIRSRRALNISAIFFLTFAFHVCGSTQVSALTHVSRLSLVIPGGSLTIEKNGETIKKTVLVKDYVSSTKMLLGEDGQISSRPSYYPYGEALSQLNLRSTRHYFTGQAKVSDDTDIYNYKARYYSPTLGIFVQPDSAEGPHRYGYVAGNPIMMNDPTGHWMDPGYTSGGGGSELLTKKSEGFLKFSDEDLAFLGPISLSQQADYVSMGKGFQRAGNKGIPEEVFMQMKASAGGLAILGGGLAGGSVMSAGGASLADLAGSTMVRSLAATGLKNFGVGAVTSGVMEVLFEKSLHEDISLRNVTKAALFGGASQAISFGMFGPEKIVASRFGQTIAEKMPRLAASKLGRAGTWLPALAVDSAIWAPTSMDPEKNDFAGAYGFELGLQSALQGSIMGLDGLGERVAGTHGLGSKIFLTTTAMVMLHNFAQTR